MEGRTALCLDAQLPKARHPMGVPHRKLPRIRPTRMHPHDAQTFMRPTLVIFELLITQLRVHPLVSACNANRFSGGVNRFMNHSNVQHGDVALQSDW